MHSLPRRNAQHSSSQNLRAVFGFNKDIQAGVHDLTDVNRQAVLCVSAHTGIIYDYENRTQLLLQGHCNAISATCVSADKKFIVTADSAPSSSVVRAIRIALCPHLCTVGGGGRGVCLRL